jgi:magnesium transporter
MGVCDNGKLVGILRIEDLLSAPPEARVSDIMDGDPPAVAPGVDQEKAAWKAVQHGESAWRSSMIRGALSALFHRIVC